MKAKVLSPHGLLMTAAILVAVVGIAAIAVGASNGVADAALPAPSAASLTEEEAAGVLFMREEEKLAYDVYVTLGETSGQVIFENIAWAEQQHMDAVGTLIAMYDLDDPLEGNDVGVFENAELQTLFDELVAQGSASPEAALEVGAVIEEVDILDLESYLAATSNADLIRVYENLLRGSENHLRAFVSRLEAAGVEREPSAMELDAYEAVLAAAHESGGGQDGGGACTGSGQGMGHGTGEGHGMGQGMGQGMGHGMGQGMGHGAGGGCQQDG